MNNRNNIPPNRRDGSGRSSQNRPMQSSGQRKVGGTAYPQNHPGRQSVGGQRNQARTNNPTRASRQAPLTPEERARRAAILKEREMRAEEERSRREKERRDREREEERRRAERKKARRESVKIFFGRLLVFFVVLAVLCALAAAIFILFFRSTPDGPKESGKVAYYFGGEKVRTVSADEVNANTTVYVCFNDLSEYLGLAESGSAYEMKFVIPIHGYSYPDSDGKGNEEYIIFSSNKYEVNINGQTVALDVPNLLKNEEIWVTAGFIETYMNNLSVTYSDSKSEVKISRIIDESNTSDRVTAYYPVSFKLKTPDPLPPVEEDTSLGEIVETTAEAPDEIPEFATDQSQNEMYLNPTGAMRDSFLVLVNKTNTLPETYEPEDLENIDSAYIRSGTSAKQLREYARRALEALLSEMYHLGYTDMKVHSAYRTYSYQAMLFDNYVKRDSAAYPDMTRDEVEALVLTYSSRPGTSEHQSGLAVDMDNTPGDFSNDFKNTDEFRWLSENAWKFGFILRFPEGKTDDTTIMFESWHYRYVGRYHAKRITESGMTLEEYTAKLNLN